MNFKVLFCVGLFLISNCFGQLNLDALKEIFSSSSMPTLYKKGQYPEGYRYTFAELQKLKNPIEDAWLKGSIIIEKDLGNNSFQAYSHRGSSGYKDLDEIRGSEAVFLKFPYPLPFPLVGKILTATEEEPFSLVTMERTRKGLLVVYLQSRGYVIYNGKIYPEVLKNSELQNLGKKNRK